MSVMICFFSVMLFSNQCLSFTVRLKASNKNIITPVTIAIQSRQFPTGMCKILNTTPRIRNAAIMPRIILLYFLIMFIVA